LGANADTPRGVRSCHGKSAGRSALSSAYQPDVSQSSPNLKQKHPGRDLSTMASAANVLIGSIHERD
jgi:hypothetical protein